MSDDSAVKHVSIEVYDSNFGKYFIHISTKIIIRFLYQKPHPLSNDSCYIVCGIYSF